MSEEKYNDIVNLHNELEKEYNTLHTKYELLQESCRENTIIQSMNDMKKEYDDTSRKYEELKRTCVSLYRFNFINERLTKLENTLKGVDVIIEHVIDMLSNLDTYIVTDRKTIIYKAQIELALIKELLYNNSR